MHSPFCWIVSSREAGICVLDLILFHNFKEIIHEILSIFPELFAFSYASQVFCDNKSFKISVTYRIDIFMIHGP